MKNRNEEGVHKGLVFIVDDEKLVRYNLSFILQSAGYQTKSFASGEELLAEKSPAEPICLLLDVTIPGGMDGPEIHRQLQARNWRQPVIFVTAHATVPMAVTAMKSGAVDVLTKPVDRAVLLSAVEKALSLSSRMHQERREQTDVNILARQLTEREKEVLSWIISGKLNKEVAYLLGITERTVKAHRANIMEKLGVVSVVDLVRFADKVGIAPGRED